jgi:hypothetical protein
MRTVRVFLAGRGRSEAPEHLFPNTYLHLTLLFRCSAPKGYSHTIPRDDAQVVHVGYLQHPTQEYTFVKN